MEVENTGLTVTASIDKKPQVLHDNIRQPSSLQSFFGASGICLHGVFLLNFWQQSVFTVCASAFTIPENEDRKSIHTICKTAKNFIDPNVERNCGSLFDEDHFLVKK
jgi:hypothetical protein